eukprot:g63093.t1
MPLPSCTLVFAQVRILFALPGHNCGLNCTLVFAQVRILFALPGHDCGLNLHRCFWLKSAVVWRSPALSEADVGNTVRSGKCPSSTSGRSSRNHSQKPAVAIVVQGEEFAELFRDDRILALNQYVNAKSAEKQKRKHKDYLSALTKGQLTKMCEQLQVSKVGTNDVLRANVRSYFTALETSVEAAKEDTTAAESEADDGVSVAAPPCPA